MNVWIGLSILILEEHKRCIDALEDQIKDIKSQLLLM